MQKSTIDKVSNDTSSNKNTTMGKKLLIFMLAIMTVTAGLLFTVFKNSSQVVVSTENQLHSKIVEFLKSAPAASGLATIKDPEFIEVKIEGDDLKIIVPVTNVVENKDQTQALLTKVLSDWIKIEFPSKPPTLKIEIMQ